MLLGNWDGGMFPGQPRRQKAIVQPRCDGCSPRASRSLPEPAATPGPGGGTAAVRGAQGGPSGSPKLMDAPAWSARARAAQTHPAKMHCLHLRGQEWH